MNHSQNQKSLGHRPLGRRPFEETLREHHAKIARVAGRLVQGVGGRLVFDEIVSVGVVALWRAWLRYDPEKSPDLWRFAALGVQGAMVDERRFMDHLSRDARQKVKGENIGRLSWALLYPCDLENAVNVSPSEDAGECDRMLEMAKRAAESLLGAERRVVHECFFEGRKVDDVAREMGVSGSRVSQLKLSAVVKMRGIVASEGYEVGKNVAKKRTRRDGVPNMLTFQGREQSIAAWAVERGINYCTLRARLERGWTVPRALTETARLFSERGNHPTSSRPRKETRATSICTLQSVKRSSEKISRECESWKP